MSNLVQPAADSHAIAQVMATAGFQQDPYPLYARLRSEQPLYRSPQGLCYLSRYVDVEKALRDLRLSNDRERITRAMTGGKGASQLLARLMRKLGRVMTNTDPPAHSRLRRLVNKAFSAARVRDFRPQIQAIADELLDAAQALGKSMDLVTAFAYPLASTVICALVGIPRRDHERVLEWLRRLENVTELGLSADEAEQLVDDVYGYLRELISQRRAVPTDDFISALIRVEDGGDRLSEEEMLSACFVLIGSGYETPMNLIGNGVWTLLRHLDQLRALRERPELLAAAIEEMLRYESPSLSVIRVVAEPVEIAGGKLEEGDMVSLLLGAANRDPDRFADPECFDITRPDSRHVSFGSSTHFCIGAPLVRVETAVAVGTLLRRFPDLRLDAETTEWRTNPSLRGLVHLEVAY